MSKNTGAGHRIGAARRRGMTSPGWPRVKASAITGRFLDMGKTPEPPKPDTIDKAIADSDPGNELFPTWIGRIELDPAPDGSLRAARVDVPQDVTADGIVRIIRSVLELGEMARVKRESEAHAGLFVPPKPKLVT